MEENFNLKANMPYINQAQLKERDIKILNNVITNSKINEQVKLYKYGNISYNEDDEKHDYPNVIAYDNYKRGKINCIIFKVNNPKRYDFLFVYQTTTDDTGHYGIFGYNSFTNICNHYYGLNLNKTNLINYLKRLST